MFYLYYYLETFDNPVVHQGIMFSYVNIFAIIHVFTPNTDKNDYLEKATRNDYIES
jgi:hypothetical protein